MVRMPPAGPSASPVQGIIAFPLFDRPMTAPGARSAGVAGTVVDSSTQWFGETVSHETCIGRAGCRRDRVAQQHEPEVGVAGPFPAHSSGPGRDEQLVERLAVRVGAVAPEVEGRPHGCRALRQARQAGAVGGELAQRHLRGGRTVERQEVTDTGPVGGLPTAARVGEQHPRHTLGHRPDLDIGARIEPDVGRTCLSLRDGHREEPVVSAAEVMGRAGREVGITWGHEVGHARPTVHRPCRCPVRESPP